MKSINLQLALFVIVAVFISFSPSLLTANGPEIGFEAGSIFPVASENIQLVSEKVTAFLPLDLYPVQPYVECEYLLKNLSDESQTFSMGFVTRVAPNMSLLRPNYKGASIRASQDGKDLKISFAPVAKSRWDSILSEIYSSPASNYHAPESGEALPDTLPVWELTIPAKATSLIEIRYYTSWSGGGEGSYRSKNFTYHARSAALWAGSIEKAEITFRFPGLAGQLLRRIEPGGERVDAGAAVNIRPGNYEWNGQNLTWKMQNWEPDEDFRISLGWMD